MTWYTEYAFPLRTPFDGSEVKWRQLESRYGYHSGRNRSSVLICASTCAQRSWWDLFTYCVCVKGVVLMWFVQVADLIGWRPIIRPTAWGIEIHNPGCQELWTGDLDRWNCVSGQAGKMQPLNKRSKLIDWRGVRLCNGEYELRSLEASPGSLSIKSV